MDIAWIIGAAACGGVLGSLVQMLVGGMGVWRVQQLQLEAYEGLARRLESEVKARAGSMGGRPHIDPLAAAVALRAAAPEAPVTRAEIMRRAGG